MLKLFLAVAAASAALMVSGCAVQVRQAQALDAREVPRGADARPIQFKKVVVKLRRGEEIGQAHIGLACLPGPKIEWKGGRLNITDDELTDAFREELEKHNYPVVGDPNALFDDPSAWKAELLVAAQISTLELNACYPHAGFGNYKDSKGGAFVRVNWQVYGQLERKVVYETSTEGSSQTDSVSSFGIERNLSNAFAMAARNLLADPGFHELVLRRDGPAVAAGREELDLLPVRAAAPTGATLEGARSATVTVYAGGGHGSGFIVSPEGYVITNEHVVREARFVTVRLSNGRKLTADVLRRNGPRDVALLKLREGDVPAAVLAKQAQLPVGTEVYAIGTPLRDDLDVTVTRGIVSAYRHERGQRLLQSDAPVHPGNSGGPLVDANGRVVGIAAQGIVVGGASQNLNFFIPIEDAVTALKLAWK